MRERPVQCADRRRAAAGLGGKELEQLAAVVERRDDLGRGRHAGDDRHAELTAALDDARAEPGSDDEASAGVARDVDLLGR